MMHMCGTNPICLNTSWEGILGTTYFWVWKMIWPIPIWQSNIQYTAIIYFHFKCIWLQYTPVKVINTACNLLHNQIIKWGIPVPADICIHGWSLMTCGSLLTNCLIFLYIILHSTVAPETIKILNGTVQSDHMDDQFLKRYLDHM